MVIPEEEGRGKGATGRFSGLGFTFKVIGGSRGSQFRRPMEKDGQERCKVGGKRAGPT